MNTPILHTAPRRLFYGGFFLCLVELCYILHDFYTSVGALAAIRAAEMLFYVLISFVAIVIGTVLYDLAILESEA